MLFKFWKEIRPLGVILETEFSYLEREYSAHKLSLEMDTASWAASSGERALFSIGDVILRFGYNNPDLGISVGNLKFPEKFVGLPSAISASTGIGNTYRRDAGVKEKSDWLRKHLASLLPCFNADRFLIYYKKAKQISYLEMSSPHGFAS